MAKEDRVIHGMRETASELPGRSVSRQIRSKPSASQGLAVLDDEPAAHDGILLLENQLCFRLYVASKEIVRRYRPYLDPLGLTYTQYITMMALWEEGSLSMKDLGIRLDLESSTLTPLVKKLESAGYVTRRRSAVDERSTVVSLTPAGSELRERAIDVPTCMAEDLAIDPRFAVRLAENLDTLITHLRQNR